MPADRRWPPGRPCRRRDGRLAHLAYRWWARYRQTARPAWSTGPARAHPHPRRTPAQLEAAILELRQSRQLGPARIAPLVGLPASTVYRVLCRHRMNRLALLDRPTGQLIRRYERARPGELVHVDVKKLGRIPAGGAIGSMAATRPSTAAVTGTVAGSQPRLRLRPRRGRRPLAAGLRRGPGRRTGRDLRRVPGAAPGPSSPPTASPSSGC